jgi:hypothetical protein
MSEATRFRVEVTGLGGVYSTNDMASAFRVYDEYRKRSYLWDVDSVLRGSMVTVLHLVMGDYEILRDFETPADKHYVGIYEVTPEDVERSSHLANEDVGRRFVVSGGALCFVDVDS